MRFFHFVSFAIFLISFRVMAADLADDSFALRNCRFMPEASVRNLCIEYVKGHRFDNRAVEVCARGRDYSDRYGSFNANCFRQIRGQQFDGYSLRVCEHLADDESLLTCLRLIQERRPETAARLEACARQNRDSQVLDCLRKQVWHTLREDPHLGSGPPISADGTPAGR